MDRYELVDRALGAAYATADMAVGGLYLLMAYHAARSGGHLMEAMESYFGGESLSDVGSNLLSFAGSAGSVVLDAAVVRGAGSLRDMLEGKHQEYEDDDRYNDDGYDD